MHTPEEVTLKALEQAKSVNADCYVSLPSPSSLSRRHGKVPQSGVNAAIPR